MAVVVVAINTATVQVTPIVGVATTVSTEGAIVLDEADVTDLIATATDVGDIEEG